MDIRGLLVYCSDYKCSDDVEISAVDGPDNVRLSDLEPLVTCQACGTKGRRSQSGFQLGAGRSKAPS
jgi:hypothetical protein